MRAAIVALQVLISLVLTATIMPVLLVTYPAAQNDRVGQLLVVGVFVLTFTSVALIWPRRKARADASSRDRDGRERPPGQGVDGAD